MDLPERQIVELSRVQVSMLSAGPQQGPPVVLIHGIPTGAELWRDTLVRLAQAGFRVYAPDMPGYGETRYRNDGDYSLGGAAEVLNEWMASSGIARADIVAHDIGGGAAQILAARHPNRIARMVLSDTIVGDSWPVTPIRILQMLARLGLFGLIAASGLYKIDPYMNRQLRHTFANPDLADLPDIRSRIFFDGKMTTPAGREAFAAHLKTLDNKQTLAVEEGLFDLEIPVMLLWGAEDRFQPWEGPGRRLHRIFPHAAVKIIADAGHFLMLDQPQAYAESLLGWLEQAG